MTKRQELAVRQANELRSAGYDISARRAIRMHHGEETKEHLHCKTAVAHILAGVGYRVDSEVEHESGVIADVIGYGLEDRHPVVVELESDYSTQLKRENIDKYRYDPIYEVFTFDVTQLPTEIDTLHSQISKRMGL